MSKRVHLCLKGDDSQYKR